MKKRKPKQNPRRMKVARSVLDTLKKLVPKGARAVLRRTKTGALVINSSKPFKINPTQSYKRMKIEEIFPQVDGGVRYLVSSPHGKVTVDADRENSNAKLTAFVRPGNRFSDPNSAEQAAMRLVRSRIARRSRDYY